MSWFLSLQTSNRDKPSDSLQLMGGKIEELGSQVLGIDDGVNILLGNSWLLH